VTAGQGAIGHFERMLHLRRVPVLGTLAPHDLSVVAELARERSFSPGQALLREGEPVTSSYYVVEGEVAIQHEGRASVIFGGAELGGLHLLARETEGPQAVARQHTRVLEMEAEAVFELFDDEFPILHHVLRELCRQLVVVQKRDPRWPERPAWHTEIPSADLDLVERIFVMRQAPVFAHASINALAELSRGLVEVRFEPGATVWEMGHAAEWVLLVVAGTLDCQLPRGTGFKVGPGAPLGALETVAEIPRWYTATATSAVRGLQGHVGWLIDVFEDNVPMALEYLAYMARLLLRAWSAPGRMPGWTGA
jgi:CRP-like cAMP-binding protein